MTESQWSRTRRRASAAAFFALPLALLAGCGEGPEPAADISADFPAAEEAEPAALAEVRFISPQDGAVFDTGDVTVTLGASNVSIVPAGDTTPNSGHHHLLLNVEPLPEGEPIPADTEGYVHLGQAQTEYTFEGLAPGDYTVVAVIGDFAHRVIPQATDSVRFTVRGPQ